MRAINEDDVKRLIRSEKRNWDVTQFPGVTEALNHVEGGLVGIRTMDQVVPHWISVEERLPEFDIDVLVFATGDFGSVITITSYSDHLHGFNIKGWVSPWQYFHKNYTITHWMPIPQPPEEDA